MTHRGFVRKLAAPRYETLDHDPIRLNRIMISSLCLSMISSENRLLPIGSWPEGMLFRVMLQVLLPVLKHVLIVQVPVLPQLQGREQHHESAKA